jgi:hypothetical protein
MAPRAVEGRLVGYAEDVYGGYLIKTKTGSLIVRRDVRFDDYSKDRRIFNEKELHNSIYNEDRWNEYMFSVRDNEIFERVDKKDDNDTIEDRTNTNPKDLYEQRREKFRRETRSRAKNNIAVNNYVLKPGEDSSKIITPNNCEEALNDRNP